MNTPPDQDPPAEGMSSDSEHTLPSRPLQPGSDPSVSKRVCFYKSGDYKFSGHRMIITARTFKTFDALLDALSKKVPLPFGVRTISTPQGTHFVRALDDLQDGGAYVCSDQKRVKPLNLDEVNRRQVPWNTTRPVSAARRRRQGLRLGQFGRDNDATNRTAKVTNRVAVRTPKKLVVIKNRDPTVKRTIVLQRRTAPTFDALLDYLSQILQFPVLKLYSTDGRRVDGLAALILCSGVVVAAGNEPFRLGHQNSHTTAQTAQIMYVETEDPPIVQPRTQKNKSFSSGRGSRNFSLSSERYIISQINKSQNGSMNNYLHRGSGPFEKESLQHRTSMQTSDVGRENNEHHSHIIPQDNDIEKSFCVNQDGSMTVEMKVRLTLKEEEMLHWTTTLSRSSLSKKTACASRSESGDSSSDSNNPVAKDSSNIQENETKEKNYQAGAGKGVGFNDERLFESYTSTTSGKAKSFKRTPTPGPRQVNKKTSVESVKMVTETGVQESTLGHYSYMEKTADGETTEGYCVVRHSSSSNRPIPKPRKTASAEVKSKCPSVKSPGVTEVLQIQNDGMEVRETVMHIYESQGCYDNYFANEEGSADGTSLQGSPPVVESKPSTNSSSDGCDIDCNWQPPTADSQEKQNDELLSLSSEPEYHQVTNNLTSAIDKESEKTETQKNDHEQKAKKKKNITRPGGNHKSVASTSSTDNKQKDSTISSSKQSKYSSTSKLSSVVSAEKKSQNSLKSSKSDPTNKRMQRPLSVKVIKEEKSPKRDSNSLVGSQKLKMNATQRQNTSQSTTKENGHNVNTPTGRPPMKKNMSDILQTKKSSSSSTKTNKKPKSMIEYSLSPPKNTLELSESGSMPSLNPSPSEVHQYVENWLEKVSPDQVPYMEEPIANETEPHTKVVFKIGDDSESDEVNECQNNLGETLEKSSSCLSVPLCQENPPKSLLQIDQRPRGLCVSMPSVRADPLFHENRLRSHKSAEVICANESETSPSNILSPKAKIKPVLRQLCSSIQCIRRASSSNISSTLHNSNSLPDFSTQVASVFGSSCKAFLSFLSVMTLKDSLKASITRESGHLKDSSEAMLMMESLQKISAIEDEEEQKASLTDLQSRASSNLRDRWKDFQILRERLESEPLSPKVSETEFALDVVSEGGDVFEEQNLGIDELMEELNMPKDLREEITSTLQYTRSFYPVEESTFVETVPNHSESEDDVEQFVQEHKDKTIHLPELDDKDENTAETMQGLDKRYGDHELKTEKDETSKECARQEENDENNDGFWNRADADEENYKNKLEKKKELEDGQMGEDDDQDSVVKVAETTEEELTGDEDEIEDRSEGENRNELDDELVQEETEENDSNKDTDEREGAGETEEEEKNQTEEREVQNEEEVSSTTIVEGKEIEQADLEDADEEVVNETSDGHEDEEEDLEDLEEEAKEDEEGDEELRGYAEKIIDEVDIDELEEHEVDEVIETVVDEDATEDREQKDNVEEGDKKEQFTETVSEGNSEELDDKEDEEQEDENSYEEEIEDDDHEHAEDKRNSQMKRESSEGEKNNYNEDLDDEESIAAEHDEEEENSDEENELNEELKEMEQTNNDMEEALTSEDLDACDDQESKNYLEEATYMQQHFISCDKSNVEHISDSPSKNSSEGQCADDRGTDTLHETDGEEPEEMSNSLSHPVQISQELLDFVNYALQSCSVVFTYDTQGKMRLEPENAVVVQTKQIDLPRVRKESSYGLKSLPSPVTSDLSDYRPETSESGGYKTQESVDVVSDSGEEASGNFSSVNSCSSHSAKRANVKQSDSKLSLASNSEGLHDSQIKSMESLCSSDAGIKVSREGLSCFSTSSSLRANTEAGTQNAPCTVDKESADGVLIDRGRWLLKENHLIRKSPPVSLGMYGNSDSSSMDMGHENTSEDSPPHTKTQQSPLAAISSSELEEMAKPFTPKCTYFNLPHGSDSDPFLDDSSIRSGKHDASSVRGRGFKVSPVVDTSKTWTNRNGSLSSFASVEFKISDRKVHPEGETSTVVQPRRTSTGEQAALQAQDSLDSLFLRCGQYCPIL